MKKNNLLHGLELTIWGTLIAFAVTANAEQKVAATVKASEPAITPMGMLDVRPGYLPKSGEFYSENAAELGAKIGKNAQLSYFQAFNSNLLSRNEATTGVAPSMQPGYIRGKLNNIWENAENKLKLSYEQRLYLPVTEAQQNTGLIFASRNYFKLNRKINDTVSLTLSEIPIFFLNSRSGVGAGATARANNIFENRVYLIADFTLTEKLSLSIPLMFHQTRTGNYGEAANANGWSHFVWTAPELDYQVAANTTLGVAYYNNDSLMAADLSDTNISGALESGVVQLVFTQTL